jgi:hypothetical protein
MWITLLACADSDGYCAGSIVGFAAMARMSVEDAEKTIAKLESPDVYSRTPDHDGKRILKVDGGWVLVNYTKYREMAQKEQRREYLRLKKQEQRNREKSQMSTNVNNLSTTPSASASSSALEEGKIVKKGNETIIPPQKEWCADYAKVIGFIGWESWFDHFESNGWKVGGKTLMKNWQSAMRNGKRRNGAKRNISRPEDRI